MAEKFEIGEVAIYVRPGSTMHGDEVTVMSGLVLSNGGMDGLTGKSIGACMVYEISHPSKPTPPGYKRRVALPEWLRKKKPHRDIDQIVSWDDCLWKPQPILGVA